MKCKPYSEITVEIRTQLKTVKTTSNIFAVRPKISGFFELYVGSLGVRSPWFCVLSEEQQSINPFRFFLQLRT